VTVSETGTYVAMHATPARLFIGRDDLGNATTSNFKYANGAIDEVSIWGVELSAAEVMDLYTGGPYKHVDGSSLFGHSPEQANIIPGPGDLSKHTQYTNLVSWWRLGDTGDTVSDAGVISTAVDKKGSNNLTGQNSPVTTGGAPAGEGPTFATKSFNDNAFVSHMIPRSDKQTRWITGSII
jgi:hypothetical protein